MLKVSQTWSDMQQALMVCCREDPEWCAAVRVALTKTAIRRACLCAGEAIPGAVCQHLRRHWQQARRAPGRYCGEASSLVRQSMFLRWISLKGALLNLNVSNKVVIHQQQCCYLQHLIGPEGEVLIQYEAGARPDQIGQSIADEMADYKRKNPAWHGCVLDLPPLIIVLSSLPCTTPSTLFML